MPSGNPWDVDSVPFTVKLPAARVHAWRIVERKTIRQIRDLYRRPYTYIKKTGRFSFTPKFPAKATAIAAGFGEEETITLVPMAAAKVRITIFPNYK